MKNKDKDIKQKVAEYMDILGIYVPDDTEDGQPEDAPEPEDGGNNEHS